MPETAKAPRPVMSAGSFKDFERKALATDSKDPYGFKRTLLERQYAERLFEASTDTYLRNSLASLGSYDAEAGVAPLVQTVGNAWWMDSGLRDELTGQLSWAASAVAKSASAIVAKIGGDDGLLARVDAFIAGEKVDVFKLKQDLKELKATLVPALQLDISILEMIIEFVQTIYYEGFKDQFGFYPCDDNMKDYCETTKQEEHECPEDEEAECVLLYEDGEDYHPSSGVPASQGQHAQQSDDGEPEVEQAQEEDDEEVTIDIGAPADQTPTPDVDHEEVTIESGEPMSPADQTPTPDTDAGSDSPDDDRARKPRSVETVRPPDGPETETQIHTPDPGPSSGDKPGTVGIARDLIRDGGTVATPDGGPQGETVAGGAPKTTPGTPEVVPEDGPAVPEGKTKARRPCRTCADALSSLKGGVGADLSTMKEDLDCLWKAASLTKGANGKLLTEGLDRSRIDSALAALASGGRRPLKASAKKQITDLIQELTDRCAKATRGRVTLPPGTVAQEDSDGADAFPDERVVETTAPTRSPWSRGTPRFDDDGHEYFWDMKSCLEFVARLRRITDPLARIRLGSAALAALARRDRRAQKVQEAINSIVPQRGYSGANLERIADDLAVTIERLCRDHDQPLTVARRPDLVAVDGEPPMINVRSLVQYRDWVGWTMRAFPASAGGRGGVTLPPEVLRCPPSLVVYVHGLANTHEDATRTTRALQERLSAIGYRGTVVGFSWNTLGLVHFSASERGALMYGGVLANLLREIRRRCPRTRINIIAHSLGAAVVLEAMRLWGTADSVQLVAPAVSQAQLEPGGRFARSEIIERAGSTHVWYSEPDVALFGYWLQHGSLLSGPTALGEEGFRASRVSRPELSQSAYTELLGDDTELGTLWDDVGGTHSHSGYIRSPLVMRAIREKLR